MSTIAKASQPRILVTRLEPALRSAISELVIPAVLVRSSHTSWDELVHVYVPQGPTVAFSSRDLRRPGILEATTIARNAGFAAVVRSPGGQMVAYDNNAVVIDHLNRTSDIRQAGTSTFSDNASSHAAVLRKLSQLDVRIGAVEGEYCPGEFSLNVAGQAKVVGSAQRVTGTGSLFSTVVQVAVSDRVRDVIEAVSVALGYDLRPESIAGLTDYADGLTAEHVADALAADYRARRGLVDSRHPESLLECAAAASIAPQEAEPFNVDHWARQAPPVGSGPGHHRVSPPST